jgi:tRNA G18 (ribose-2'-O)-methylase SpoU
VSGRLATHREEVCARGQHLRVTLDHRCGANGSIRALLQTPGSNKSAAQRTVVLLGHEWHGIRDEHVEAADVCVRS